MVVIRFCAKHHVDFQEWHVCGRFTIYMQSAELCWRWYRPSNEYRGPCMDRQCGTHHFHRL